MKANLPAEIRWSDPSWRNCGYVIYAAFDRYNNDITIRKYEDGLQMYRQTVSINRYAEMVEELKNNQKIKNLSMHSYTDFEDNN
jgi:uncharacterized membrane protein